jgi:hypothetical protein
MQRVSLFVFNRKKSQHIFEVIYVATMGHRCVAHFNNGNSIELCATFRLFEAPNQCHLVNNTLTSSPLFNRASTSSA